MPANRLRHLQQYPQQQPLTAVEPAPAAAAVPTVPAGFAVCPPQIATAQSWQQELYRRAYEQAIATTSVPRHYRMLFSVWN
ncbi:MAG: hypothetical protein AB7O59_05110 [Pirellulales bacterium]